ncbi:hypothetical protein ACTXT7_013258 [Hymenolepis weldensis]
MLRHELEFIPCRLPDFIAVSTSLKARSKVSRRQSQLIGPSDTPGFKVMFQLMPNSITAELLQSRELKKVDSPSVSTRPANANIPKKSECEEQIRMRDKDPNKHLSRVQGLRHQFGDA